MSARSRSEVREQLVDAGLMRPYATDGLYAFTGEYEAVLHGVDRLVRRSEPTAGFVELGVPPLLPEDAFVATGYLRSFPQLIGSVDVFLGTPRDHRDMLAGQLRGQDWTEHLQPARLDLLSAPCHGSYPLLAGRELSGPEGFGISARCWRHEPSPDPFRLITFRMREKVVIGTPQDAVAHRDAAREAGPQLLRSLGLPIRVEVANDPFFGRAAGLLAEGQLDAQLKHEFVFDGFADDPGVALGSVNYHQDHFGIDFEMTTPDGQPAHSSCVGFGLERVTTALFAVHGMGTSQWPDDVRVLLDLSS